jgi:uncharacterized protein YjdB
MKKLVLLSFLSFYFAFSSQAQRWYSYDEYLNNVTFGGIGYSILPIWNDTTSVVGYGGSIPGYYNNTFTSVGLSFAPILTAWNDTGIYHVLVKVGPTDAYTIDSIRLYGVYLRNNARTSPVDTLFMSFVNGNGSGTTNLQESFLHGLLGTYGYDPLYYLTMGHDSINNRAGQLSGASATPYVVYVTLHSTDTASFFNQTITLPAPYAVPAGSAVGMSLSFKSGDATFTPGDTTIYSSGAYKYGQFSPYIEYYGFSGSPSYAYYDPLDSNYGYFKKEGAPTWGGQYIPLWAWSAGGIASELQYPVIDYHVHCTSCMLNDTITGSMHVCAGDTVHLAFSVPGGSWTSGSSGIATVSSTGVLTAVSGGVVNITYAIGTNKAISSFTVDPLPPAITGTFTLCALSTTALADALPGGTWSSSTPSVATVSVAGMVSGISAGVSVISYTSIAGCVTSHSVTVNPVPPAIMGTTGLCVAGTTTLSDAAPAGSWTTSSPSIATVGASTGIVSGIGAGTAVITYTVAGCSAMITVTVAATPVAGTITGGSTVCAGSTITLIDVAPGGIWSSGTTSIATVSGGVVSGVTAGVATISYTVTNACGTAYATMPVTVNPMPVAGTVTGSDTVCVGRTVSLTDLASGGVWSSGGTAIATVTSAGLVTGVAGGTVNISYSVTNSCGTAYATLTLHVIPTATCALLSNTVALSENPQLKIFPNPNEGTFAINIVSGKNEEATVVICNVTGEKVMEFKVTTNKANEISLKQPAGVYIVTATSSDGTYVSKLLIK